MIIYKKIFHLDFVTYICIKRASNVGTTEDNNWFSQELNNFWAKLCLKILSGLANLAKPPQSCKRGKAYVNTFQVKKLPDVTKQINAIIFCLLPLQCVDINCKRLR